MVSGEWRIEHASSADAAEVYDLLKCSFFPDEPATCRLFQKYGVPEMEGCISIRALSQGLSLKAVSAADGSMVGVALILNAETLPNREPTAEPGLSLKRFFSYVDEHSGGEEPNFLTLQVITVHPDWRRKGIAESLVQVLEKQSVEQGYVGCRVVCSSSFTARLVEKRGWKQVCSLPYSEYPDPTFTSGPPHLACTVYLYRHEEVNAP